MNHIKLLKQHFPDWSGDIDKIINDWDSDTAHTVWGFLFLGKLNKSIENNDRVTLDKILKFLELVLENHKDLENVVYVSVLEGFTDNSKIRELVKKNNYVLLQKAIDDFDRSYEIIHKNKESDPKYYDKILNKSSLGIKVTNSIYILIAVIFLVLAGMIANSIILAIFSH